MKTIQLTQGQVVRVDDEDYLELCNYEWYAQKKRDGYWCACRKEHRGKKYTGIYMSRHLFDLEHGDKRQVMFLDHDSLNCQRENLVVVTRHEVQQHKRKTLSKSSSKYKGVCWDNTHGKWYASSKPNGKFKSLGLYDNEIDAARAYDAHCIKEFGKFSNPNFKVSANE